MITTPTSSTTDSRDIAQRIRAVVTRDGRTVAEVARAADIEPDTLRAKLRGERPIWVPDFLALAQALGVSPSVLAREAGL